MVGFIHSLLSTLFAYGALLHAIILRTDLRKHQVVGTLAACLTGMSVMKIVGYTLTGFDYRPFFQLIGVSIVAALIGTWIGKRVVDRISEVAFRIVFRILITVTALRLLYTGFIG